MDNSNTHNTIFVILITVILILIIILIFFTLTDDKKGHRQKWFSSCLKGCVYEGKSGNCGEPPCGKEECPYTCINTSHIGQKGWCQYDKYSDKGDSRVDCTGCGCVRE